MFRRILSVVLCVFMVASSVIPQKNQIVFAQDYLSASESQEDKESIGQVKSTSDADFDVSNVAIDFEDITKRTDNSKTFKKVDGTYVVAIYDNVVHYLQNGKFVDIDNTLRLNIEDDTLENQGNSFKVKMPNQLDANKEFRVDYDAYRISWTINDILRSKISYAEPSIKSDVSVELSRVKQNAIYYGIQENVDLEYLVQGQSIKENIILNKYMSDFSMSFNYTLKGLTLERNEQGQYVFVNEKNVEMFQFGSLYMVDSNGNESNNIQMNVTKTSDTEYKVDLIADTEFLKNATFPVIIDPEFSIIQNPSFIDDTFVAEGNPDVVHNLLNGLPYNYMRIGNNVTGQRYRGLLKFDMPSQASEWYITSAKMTLTKSVKYAGAQINLHRNTSDFAIDSVTWNNQPGIDQTIEAYHIIDVLDTYTFDITGSVKYWQGNPNYGFSIRSNNEYQGYNSVKTVESTTTAQRPLIEIVYIERAGLLDYWTYDSQNLGDAGTGFIAENSGYYSNSRKDVSFSNAQTTLSLSFIYASDPSDRGINLGYGYGWRSIYDVSWHIDEFDSSVAYVAFGDGHTEFFKQQTYCSSDIAVDPLFSYTCYLSEEGNGKIFVKKESTSANSYYLQTKNADKYYFTNYWLSSIVYYDGNRIDIYRNANGKIAYFIDLYSNYVAFTYDATTQLLSYIDLYVGNDQSGHHRLERNRYYYDANNNLDYIYKYNYYDTANPSLYDYYKRVDYSFDSSHTLLSFQNSRNSVTVTYAREGNQITSYTTMDGTINLGKITFEYTPFATTIQDQYGNQIKSFFDAYGHTVINMDDDGNASYIQYLNNYEDPQINYNLSNKVIATTPVQNSQMNLLHNGSFDDQSYVATGTEGGWYKTGYPVTGLLNFNSETVSGIGTNYFYQISRSSGNSYPYMLAQKVTLDKGEYTLRGRILNSAGASPYGNGAYISINGASASSQVIYVANSTTYQDVSQTFRIDNDNTVVYVYLGNWSYSTAKFDNIQIDTGYVDTKYNFVSNPSFESSLARWTCVNCSRTTVSDDFRDIALGNTAVLLSNSTLYTRVISQTINMEIHTGDVLSFGAWIKSYYSGNNDITNVRLGYVRYQNGLPNETFWTTIPVNRFTNDWQYIMGSVEITGGYLGNYGSVYLEIEYRGANPIYADGFQVYKEPIHSYISYNSDGNVSKLYTNSENSIDITYDQDDPDRISEIDDNGNTMDLGNSMIPNPDGTIASIVENNVRTDFEYTNGKITSTKVTSLGGSNNRYYTESTSYAHLNQYQSSKTNRYGDTVVFDYNTNNTLLESVGLPNGSTQYFNYDRSGMLTSSYINNHLGEIAYTYDTQDRLSTISVNGLVYQLTYNTLDQVVSIQVAGVSLISTDYREKVVDGITYYTNMVTSEQYANGNTYFFTYNEKDQISQISYKSYPSAQEVAQYAYFYDSMGRINILNDFVNNKTYYYLYNSTGTISRITDESNNFKAYQYDEFGSMSGYTYYYVIGSTVVSRTVSFDYNTTDKRMHETAFTNGADLYEKIYTYDDDYLGRISSVLFNKNASKMFDITYAYDDSDVVVESGSLGISKRINKITFSSYYGGVYYYFYIEYKYDALGNVVEDKLTRTIATPGYGSSTSILYLRTYHYDSLNQLIRENYCESNCSTTPTGFTYVYEYNTNGNRSYLKEYAYTPATSTPTTLIESHSYQYSSTWKDQLVSVDGDSYSYDAQGNVTSIINSALSEEITMSYKGREMVSYLYENAATMASKYITYSYDQDGYRVSKNVDGTIHRYFLDGPRVLVETIGTTVIHYTYDDEGKLISLNLNGTEYFYQRNALGDIIGIYLTNGSLVVSYEYDAYGNIISKVDNSGIGLATLNPYRYRGYRFDEETGLYYLNSRYLNPETGRFLCSDGYLGSPGQLLSTNMYTYALNNPNTYFDPTGYIPVLLEIAIGIFIDVAIDAAFAAITGPAVVALQFLTNILSEIITTVFINLLNGVDWALNLDKNILTAAVFGGVMIVGGIVVAKLMKKFKVTETIGSVLKKIFGKVDNYIDQTDEVALALAKNTDDISYSLVKNADDVTEDLVGDLANGVCFIAGTKVATDEGLVNIEEIEVGDRVYATDPENGETALKVVKQTYINVTATLVHIDIQDEQITTTPTHPFYVIGRGWVAAKHLREGDQLLSLNGESVYIEKVSIENLDEAIKVYNLEIEGFHTYHVGQSRILVHNTCPQKIGPTNPKIVTEDFLRSFDIDPHALKAETLKSVKHKGISVSAFDIYQDAADSGRLWLGRRLGKGMEWIDTFTSLY